MITLFHDDDDVGSFEEQREGRFTGSPEPHEGENQSTTFHPVGSSKQQIPPPKLFSTTPFQSSGRARTHSHQYLSLEKVPIPRAAQNLRERVSPYLLFRPPLMQPTPLSSDPWSLMPEDVALDRMWDPTGSQLGGATESTNRGGSGRGWSLLNCPTTSYLTHSLRKRQQRSRSLLLNADQSYERGHSFSRKRHDRMMQVTRDLLEKQNVLREIEDMKTREVSHSDNEAYIYDGCIYRKVFLAFVIQLHGLMSSNLLVRR